MLTQQFAIDDDLHIQILFFTNLHRLHREEWDAISCKRVASKVQNKELDELQEEMQHVLCADSVNI